jgi:hypothetical protein
MSSAVRPAVRSPPGSKNPRAASSKLQAPSSLNDERDPGPWVLDLPLDPLTSELTRACFVLPAGHHPSGGAASVSEAWGPWTWAACRRLKMIATCSSWGKVENWHPMIVEIAAYGNRNGGESVAYCRWQGWGMRCWRT